MTEPPADPARSKASASADQAANQAAHHDTQAWAAGLSGRAGDGASHREGQALREALLGDININAPPPDWAVFTAHARADAGAVLDTAADAVSTRPAQPAQDVGQARPEAANQPRWRIAIGGAAAAALAAVTLVVLWQPGDDGETRMRGAGGGAVPTWHVADPAQQADTLAGELRAMGAQVSASLSAACTSLHIEAAGEEPRRLATARLSAFETAFDAQGRVELRVCPPRQ